MIFRLLTILVVCTMHLICVSYIYAVSVIFLSLMTVFFSFCVLPFSSSVFFFFFFFNDTAPPEIYPLSLHAALPISLPCAIRSSASRKNRGSSEWGRSSHHRSARSRADPRPRRPG